MDETPLFKYERVMVVDDNDIDLLIADRIIKRFQLSREVISIESGREALDFLSDPENIQNLPEVIFLDINMPEMSGFDFLDEYEKLPESIKNAIVIVMLTSSMNPDDHMKAIQNPYVHKFVNKPLTQEKIEALNELT